MEECESGRKRNGSKEKRIGEKNEIGRKVIVEFWIVGMGNCMYWE